MSERKKGTAPEPVKAVDPIDARRHVAGAFDTKAPGVIPHATANLSDAAAAVGRTLAGKGGRMMHLIPEPPVITYAPHAVFQMRDALAKRIHDKIPGAMPPAVAAAAEELICAGIVDIGALAVLVEGRAPDDFDPPRRRVEGPCSAAECRASFEHEHGEDCSPVCICWRA